MTLIGMATINLATNSRFVTLKSSGLKLVNYNSMTVQKSNPELQIQPVARTRRRLSFASWFLASAIFVLWVLVAIPGETRKFSVQGPGLGMTREHG